MAFKGKYIKRYLVYLFSSCICVLCCSVDASKNTTGALMDSLCFALKEAKDTGKRMEILRSIASLNRYTPIEEKYLKELQTVSFEADSIDAYYEASRLLAYYYCNFNQGDDLFAILEKVESVAEERKEKPNALFDIRNRICRYYLINEEYEVAMNELVSLLRDVEEAGYKDGIIVTNENLGLIYLLIGRYEESIEPLEKSLSLLQETDDQLTLEIQIMSYLSAACLHQGELDKIRSLLDYYQTKLDIQAPVLQNNPAEILKRNSSYCMLYSYWVNYYVVKNMKEEAGMMVDKASHYIEGVDDPGYTSVYYLALARYYHLVKNNKLAKEYVDKSIELDYALDPLMQKITILQDAGELDQALMTYDETVKLINQQNVAAFTRQLDQLHAFHSLMEKEKQEQLLQNQKVEITRKQQQLIAFSIFACVLITLLLSVIRYALRIRKLKNSLEKEQVSLKETTVCLKVAKEAAEKADQLKTNFIANVSHEIRTPLNAIVGFSALLDDVTEDEQDEFINIINVNTDLLLKLVNDVLDLSKLEADNFTLDIQDVDVLLVCEEVLSSIHSRIAEGVKLTFTHPDVPLILRTDPSRLQQLLLNLLINAAKYTEQGEINLDYKVDEETNELVFAVTDTGCGIPIEKHDLIFNRFEKLDSFKQGVGLGLPICNEIIRRLGGCIFIDPQYVHGARFIIKFPYVF